MGNGIDWSWRHQCPIDWSILPSYICYSILFSALIFPYHSFLFFLDRFFLDCLFLRRLLLLNNFLFLLQIIFPFLWNFLPFMITLPMALLFLTFRLVHWYTFFLFSSFDFRFGMQECFVRFDRLGYSFRDGDKLFSLFDGPFFEWDAFGF